MLEAEAALRQADRLLAGGQVDAATAEYARAAHLFHAAGFYAKASAVYKRLLKITGPDDFLLRRLAEMAGLQNLGGEARIYFAQLAARARARGDRRLEIECLLGVGALPDADHAARLAAVGAALDLGESRQALALLADRADVLAESGQTSALRALVEEAARIETQDPGFLLHVAQLQQRIGDDPAGLLLHVVSVAPGRAHDVALLAQQWRVAGDVELAFRCVELLADVAVLAGETQRAVDLVESFLLGGEHAPARARLDALRAERAKEPVGSDRASARDAAAPPAAAHRVPGRADMERPGLEAHFEALRAHVSSAPDVRQGADQLRVGLEHAIDGAVSEAVTALEAAAQQPLLRFAAAAQLGRLEMERGNVTRGVEWLERAAEVPPPTPDDGHALLYELAAALESTGEAARALAVLMELRTNAPGYRDVEERVQRLWRSDSEQMP